MPRIYRCRITYTFIYERSEVSKEGGEGIADLLPPAFTF